MWRRLYCRIMGGHTWTKHRTVLRSPVAQFDAEVQWCTACNSVRKVDIVWPLSIPDAIERFGIDDVSIRLNENGRPIAYPTESTAERAERGDSATDSLAGSG